MAMGDRLRRLWDFDDLEATGARLRSQLDTETGGAGRPEVLTQLARDSVAQARQALGLEA
jgi:hypothetical protein